MSKPQDERIERFASGFVAHINFALTMNFYKSPLKNPSAAILSFLLGISTLTAIVYAIRIREDEKRALENTLPVTESIPIDPELSKTQQSISEDREQKLGTIPAGKKTVTETQPVTITTTVPATQGDATATSKKSDRTTKTS